MIDRNELLASACDRAVLRGILRPSAAADVVIIYKNECVVESDNDTVTLHGKDLDTAVAELVAVRPHWRVEKPTTDSVSAEVERAALLATHKEWGAAEKPPELEKKTPKRTNPFSKAGWNITAQMALFKAVGAEACAEIAAAAGSHIGATHPNENFAGASGDRHVDAIADRARDVKNPWTREGWNITRQGQIYKQVGPKKAAELAAAAGVKLHATRPA
jgi:hypothetical protein